MSQLQLFKYADRYPFAVIVIDGDPWFIGKEVCDALGYANQNDAMARHCRGVAKRYPIADSLGRMQETRIISEPDMMRLAIGSNLPSAQEFERWVFEDVLPSVRKTGGYSIVKGPSIESRAVEIIENTMRAAAIFNVPRHYAETEAAKMAFDVTGVDYRPLLKHSPAQDRIEFSDVMLEPTELGKLYGRSATATNRLLQGAGLQNRVNYVWTPTPLADGKCAMHHWEKNGKTGYNLKWRVSAIKHLLEAK